MAFTVQELISMSKIRKLIAILLVVLFVVTMTVSAVSAATNNLHPIQKHNVESISDPTASAVKYDTSQLTITATRTLGINQ
jgi:hypothetical protein